MPPSPCAPERLMPTTRIVLERDRVNGSPGRARQAFRTPVPSPRGLYSRVWANPMRAPAHAPRDPGDRKVATALWPARVPYGAPQRRWARLAVYAEPRFCTPWPLPCILVSLWDVKGVDGSSARHPARMCRGCVGALWGSGVSADAHAYFGTRAGVAPGRRHDVVGGLQMGCGRSNLSRPFPARLGSAAGLGNWPRFIVDRRACRVTRGRARRRRA